MTEEEEALKKQFDQDLWRVIKETLESVEIPQEFPLFPVGVTKEDFDRNGETSHGGGLLFDKGVVADGYETYLFDINGRKIKGIVSDDYSTEHVSSMLNKYRVDMRQMKIVLSQNYFVRSTMYITYYQLRTGCKEVIYVIAYKMP